MHGHGAEAAAFTEISWWEAEVHRVAGEVALQSPKPDAPKAEACFERALAVARKQQATSLELRASMSMARLWRDQGKRDEARDILALVYGWFTEGFDTRDLARHAGDITARIVARKPEMECLLPAPRIMQSDWVVRRYSSRGWKP